MGFYIEYSNFLVIKELRKMMHLAITSSAVRCLDMIEN